MLSDRPNLSIERGLKWQGAKFVAGVDEAGRGSLAGPVVAAAVILPRSDFPEGIDDSKRLSPHRRRQLAIEIKAVSMTSLSVVDVDVIERLNILGATMQAMRLAVENLPKVPDQILIDGNRLPSKLNAPATAIVKGDTKSVSIAAASIIAKVERDELMAKLAVDYPQYNWAKNAGYGTAEHLQSLQDYGPTPYHRKSFAPVRRATERRLGGTEK